MVTIALAIQQFLESVALARSERTATTYRFALKTFTTVLEDHDVNPAETPVDELSEDAVAWFAVALKPYAPTTERLYLTAITMFYKFLVAERLSSSNLPRVQMLIHQRARRLGKRLPQFNRYEIEDVINYAINIAIPSSEDEAERFRCMRDRAFLIVLADTGLRVHEACHLRRGDVDWNEGKAIVIGKGNKEAVIRLSTRSLTYLKDYLNARSKLDGASGKHLTSLPLFARHDKGAGKKIKPITTTTGRNIVKQRVGEALGEEAVGTITPHSFRHYFVTRVLQASGNLKLAQELARHQNISVTQRYAHLSDDELDKGYYEVFEEN